MGFILTRKSCLLWLIWIEFKFQSRETYQNVISPLRCTLISASISEKQTRSEQCCHGFSYHINWCIYHFSGSVSSWRFLPRREDSNTCRDRMGHSVCPTPASCAAETVEAKRRSAWAAKLALRLLRVYLFFQIQMWPWWCCFYNENWFQDFQSEEPKPLACTSVPIPVLTLRNSAPGTRPGLLCLRGAEQKGLARALGAFCLSLASADLTANASTVPPAFSAVKLLCSKHLYIFNNRLKLYSRSSNVDVFCRALDKSWGFVCEFSAWVARPLSASSSHCLPCWSDPGNCRATVETSP